MKFSYDCHRPGTTDPERFVWYTALALSNHGRWLAVIGERSVLVDLETGNETPLPSPPNPIDELCISADDRVLATSWYAGGSVIHLIDLATATMRQTIQPPSPARAMALSPDAKTLAVGLAGEVTLWHIETGQEWEPAHPHGNRRSFQGAILG